MIGKFQLCLSYVELAKESLAGTPTEGALLELKNALCNAHHHAHLALMMHLNGAASSSVPSSDLTV